MSATSRGMPWSIPSGTPHAVTEDDWGCHEKGPSRYRLLHDKFYGQELLAIGYRLTADLKDDSIRDPLLEYNPCLKAF
jgi:hypothetical protein